WRVSRAWQLSNPPPGEYGVVSALFTPDSQKLLTRDKYGWFRLREITTGKVCWEHRSEEELTGLALAPDGRTVLTVHSRTARVWSTETGTPLGRALTHQGHITAIDFSRDGR